MRSKINKQIDIVGSLVVNTLLLALLWAILALPASTYSFIRLDDPPVLSGHDVRNVEDVDETSPSVRMTR